MPEIQKGRITSEIRTLALRWGACTAPTQPSTARQQCPAIFEIPARRSAAGGRASVWRTRKVDAGQFPRLMLMRPASRQRIRPSAGCERFAAKGQTIPLRRPEHQLEFDARFAALGQGWTSTGWKASGARMLITLDSRSEIRVAPLFGRPGKGMVVRPWTS